MTDNENNLSGYELAKSAYEKLSTPPQTSVEWVRFFHEVTDNFDELYEKSRAAAFVTAMEVKNVNVGMLSKQMSQMGKLSGQYEIDMRFVDSLLERPEDDEMIGTAIEIPVELRPDYHYDDWSGQGCGKLGSIYLQEVGMHMYLPFCDIYDSDEPDELICAATQLDSSATKVSELLSALQTIVDPEHKNNPLQQAIVRCKTFESQPSSLPMLLKAHHIGVVCLAYNGWRQINCQHIHERALYAELDENDHIQVTLEPGWGFDEKDNPFDATAAGFGELSNFMKEALNRARNF